jgi:hypothetical protein
MVDWQENGKQRPQTTAVCLFSVGLGCVVRLQDEEHGEGMKTNVTTSLITAP